MTTQILIVAIEGPCCAGKTTLSRGLQHQLADLPTTHVVCYADHVGGGRNLPQPLPASLAEDAHALHQLIDIERDRSRAALGSTSRVILADRGLHTLLAHRYAVEQVTGLACLEPAKRLLAASRLSTWPELVLYLDVPQEAVHDRNNAKFPVGSIFIDAAYNQAFRGYFTRLAAQPPPPVMWLDATADPAELVNDGRATIRRLLTHETGEEEGHNGC